MKRQWRYSGKVLGRLSAGIVVFSLATGMGWSAPAAVGEPDWPVLLEKLQSLDTTKPEAMATLRDVLAELIRGRQASEQESALKQELEAKSKEIEALRAEVQTLRTQVSATSATRAYRATTRGKPATGAPAASTMARATPALGASPGPLAASPSPAVPSNAPATAALFGKRGLKKLHRADCQFGRRIAEGDRVYFKSVQEAAAAGYEACKICKPGS